MTDMAFEEALGMIIYGIENGHYPQDGYIDALKCVMDIYKSALTVASRNADRVRCNQSHGDTYALLELPTPFTEPASLEAFHTAIIHRLEPQQNSAVATRWAYEFCDQSYTSSALEASTARFMAEALPYLPTQTHTDRQFISKLADLLQRRRHLISEDDLARDVTSLMVQAEISPTEKAKWAKGTWNDQIANSPVGRAMGQIVADTIPFLPADNPEDRPFLREAYAFAHKCGGNRNQLEQSIIGVLRRTNMPDKERAAWAISFNYTSAPSQALLAFRELGNEPLKPKTLADFYAAAGVVVTPMAGAAPSGGQGGRHPAP